MRGEEGGGRRRRRRKRPPAPAVKKPTPPPPFSSSGNKAAVLPLQLAGFDVDPLLSVHFSNHTGYPSVAGDRLGAPSFAAILGGLEANGLLGGYDYVLTGYIGSAAVLGELGGALAKMKDAGAGGDGGARRGPVVVVDPVMGDHDR